MDKKIDKLLMKRQSEAPSPRFAERIILAARDLPQQGRNSETDIIHYILKLVMLPRPAYSFACLLLIGLLLGMNFNYDDAEDAPAWAMEQTSVEELMYF